MKRILVCTDGSDYSQECCRYGAWLSKQMGALISVLYVTDLRQFEIPAIADLSGSLGIQPFEGMIEQLREFEEHKSNFVKESALKIFEEAGLSDRVTYLHKTGLLVDMVEKVSEDVDLILLGKRGENVNFATEHLGAMLERFLRTSKKPCLVTSRKFKLIDRVAIAYDGGESSKKAIRFMAGDELFKALSLHVITVAETGKEDLAAQRIGEAEQLMKQAGLYPTYQVLAGDVETSISDYVREEKVDLLIAGAYGHSRIRDFFIGSTTTELLRQCHVPVLCFR
ncbi:MAG: universal stress protein [Verrucomicrobiota bacterium]